MDIIDNLIKSKADFKLFKLTKTAKNALDFQLVLFLGTRLRKYGKKAKYHIISRDTGYQSSIDFAKEHFRIEINRAESIREAVEGKKLKLLLEDNPKVGDGTSTDETTLDIPPSIDDIREEIEKKLMSDTAIGLSLPLTQIKQISSMLVDDTKNTKQLATENIMQFIGLKRKHLLPKILECCKDYIK
jgi:hypothetical protein